MISKFVFDIILLRNKVQVKGGKDKKRENIKKNATYLNCLNYIYINFLKMHKNYFKNRKNEHKLIYLM